MLVPWLLCAALLAAGPVKNPEILTIAGTADADSLDPAWAQDTSSMEVMLNVYEPLFQFEGSSLDKSIPLLAETVPSRENGLLSPDGLVYRIPIRRGVKFHDGKEMSAEDAAYSIKRFLLSDRASGPSWLLLNPLLGRNSTRDATGKVIPEVFAEVERAVRVEGNVLILTLPHPYAPLLNLMSGRGPLVLSKAWAVAHGDWDGTQNDWLRHNNPDKQASPFFAEANGTGAFRLERWDRSTKQLVLLRFDDYWRGKAKLKRVIYKNISEFGTRKLMLQAGDADIIATSRPNISQLKGMPGVVVFDDIAYVGLSPIAAFGMKLNMKANPFVGSGKLDGDGVPSDFFEDLNMRKAFAYSVDYEAFLRDVFGGKGVLARGMIPPSLLGYAPDLPGHRLDLEEATRRLRGARGGQVWERGFRLSLVASSGDPIRLALCQMIKRNIESLNPKFKIDIAQLDWPAFLDAALSGKAPILVSGWSSKIADPHDLAFAFLHSNGYYPSRQGFSNPEIDKLIDQAYEEQDRPVRQKLYENLQRKAFELVPHLVFVHSADTRAQRSWVRGWQQKPMVPGTYLYPVSKED